MVLQKAEAPQDSMHGANYYRVLQATPQPSFQSPVAANDFHFSMSDCPVAARADYLPCTQVLQTSNSVHNSATSFCRTDIPETNNHGCFAAYNFNEPATNDDQMHFDITVASRAAVATAMSQHAARIPDIILTGWKI